MATAALAQAIGEARESRHANLRKDRCGESAARMRQRKHALLRRFQIPADALPGSLALTHRRCGKDSCHCAEEEAGIRSGR